MYDERSYCDEPFSAKSTVLLYQMETVAEKTENLEGKMLIGQLILTEKFKKSFQAL